MFKGLIPLNLCPSLPPPRNQSQRSLEVRPNKTQRREARERRGDREGGKRRGWNREKRGRANNKSPMTRPKSYGKPAQQTPNCHTDEPGETQRGKVAGEEAEFIH